MPPRDLQTLDGRQPFAGATVGNLNPAFDDELGLEPTQRGVVVSSVARRQLGAAARPAAGRHPRQPQPPPVENVTQLRSMLAEHRASPWTIAVRRRASG